MVFDTGQSNFTDPYMEDVCIIVDKVFDSCQQRECFNDFEIDLPHCEGPFTFVGIKFFNGVIEPNSIVITPVGPSQPNFSRVQLTVKIPFTLTVRDHHGHLVTENGTLPDIHKDTILYFPDSRTEFDLTLRVETRSELLVPPTISGSKIFITVGSFIILKVTAKVQLLIQAMGYCPPPRDCVESPTEDVCDTFLDSTLTPFPSDFFPPQLPNG